MLSFDAALFTLVIFVAGVLVGRYYEQQRK